MNILVDTNILTRWVDTAHTSHDKAVESLRELRSKGHIPTLVPQNLYEFWVVATRPIDVNGLGMSTPDARIELDRFRAPLFALLQDERAILPRWEELVTRYDVKGKTAHDARLVAAMLRHNVTHLLTFDDGDFARFSEIVAVTPEAIVSGKASL